MRFLTAYGWERGEKYALTLRQLRRKRGNLRILFAGICRDAGLAENWEEWFQEKILPDCRKGGAEKTAERAQRRFEEWMDEQRRRYGAGIPDFAALFCAGEECFYAWRGDMELQMLNMRFGRAQVQSLTRRTDGYGCERAALDENVGLLLGAGAFCRSLSRDAVRSCLTAVDLNGQQQADRHLAELCGEAARRGAGSTAAILVVTKGEGAAEYDG